MLYFYPKANTPGCTTQACGVRDHQTDYDAAGAVVLGVSPDPVKAVKKFAEKQHLNFELLADEDHEVCEAYGVWVEKSMYGKTYWGAKRATFVIDEEGIVRRAFKAKPETHDEDVLAILGELRQRRGLERAARMRPCPAATSSTPSAPRSCTTAPSGAPRSTSTSSSCGT